MARKVVRGPARGDGAPALDAPDFHVALPPEFNEPLGPYKGKKIIFGIRPDDIHSPDYPAPEINPTPVKAAVDVTEMMGSEFMLHMLAGEWSFLARVDARTKVNPGDEITLDFDLSKMHAFDADTTRRIL